MAVAEAIDRGGLADFYQFREATNIKAPQHSEAFNEYDLPDVQGELVHPVSESVYRIQFYIEGISCAACAWLIENHLGQAQEVTRVAVNATTQICTVEWVKSQLALSELMRRLEQIGYTPRPANSHGRSEGAQKLQRHTLMRLGVAGIGMMQVGMVAVALYAGGIQGIEGNWQSFLRWVSLVFATPVVFFSAQPFFKSAYRALKLKHLNMDAPVCIALILAYSASVYATVTNTGEVYFDSVSMFTFFLLLGRYLEMRARNSNQNKSEHLLAMLPLTAQKKVELGDAEEFTPVPLKSIVVGDVIKVDSGAIVPVDGTILQGTSSADESLLTGESTPVTKTIGDTVIAGSLNGDTRLIVVVNAVGTATALSAIEQMVDDAQQQKPAQVAIADKIAARFVAAVLILSVIVGGAWYWIDASRALWVVLSVLVITCPCALSLATPAALTAGTSRLRELGFLVRSKHVIETLANINHVVFDKTGTLTLGRFRIESIELCSASSNGQRGDAGLRDNEKQVTQIIAALEQHSRHPIAKAFEDITPIARANHVEVVAGWGVKGEVQGEMYWFGKPAFVLTMLREQYGFSGSGDSFIEPKQSASLWNCLADKHGPVAWVGLSDAMREETPAVLNQLKQQGCSISLLSGDRQRNVDVFTKPLPFDISRGDVMPEGKLAYVQERQGKGDTVLMIGDGINDAPVLSGADVSVAMSKATRLAQIKSDALLLNDDLNTLTRAMVTAHTVKETIRQNVFWALGYNLLALPAAAMGWIPPYLAAAGMSLSSLVVVLNSLRVHRL